MAVKQLMPGSTAPDGAQYVTLTDGNGNLGGPVTVDIVSNPIPSKEVRSAVATTTSVASSATSVTLAPANLSRLGITFYNDSTQILYLLLGAQAASTTVYTVQMQSGAYYEMPYTYIGQVNGIWASANGSVRITELT